MIKYLPIGYKYMLRLVMGLLVCSSWVIADPLTPAQEQLKISQECLNAPDSGMSGLAELSGDPSLASYNPRCDLRWSMEAGNTLEAAHEQIAKDKNNAVQDPNNHTDLNADYTCLGTDAGETLPDCQKRIQRETLNTISQVRNRTALYNTTRYELLSQPNAGPQQKKALVAGSIPKNAKKPNETPLSDLYDVSRYDPSNPRNTPQNKEFVDEYIQQYFSPRSINFTPPSADTISGGVQFQEVKIQTVTDPKLQETLGIDGDSHGNIQVLGDKPDTELNAKLVKALNGPQGVFTKAGYEKDQKTYIKAITKTQGMTPPQLKQRLKNATLQSQSLRSFAGSMDNINNKIKSDEKTKSLDLSKPAPSDGNRLVVTDPIDRRQPIPTPAPNPSDPWTTPLDKEILDYVP